MSFIEEFPQYAPIAAHIRGAGLVRAVRASHAIAESLLAVHAGLKELAGVIEPDNEQIARMFPRTQPLVRGLTPRH